MHWNIERLPALNSAVEVKILFSYFQIKKIEFDKNPIIQKVVVFFRKSGRRKLQSEKKMQVKHPQRHFFYSLKNNETFI